MAVVGAVYQGQLRLRELADVERASNPAAPVLTLDELVTQLAAVLPPDPSLNPPPTA